MNPSKRKGSLRTISQPKCASSSIDSFLNAKVNFVENLVSTKANIFNAR